MLQRTLLIFVSLLITACASSENQKPDSGPVAVNNLTTPPLSQAFPLDPKPDAMRVQYPVLLDDHTILNSNAVLRFVYNKPIGGPQGHGPLRNSGESVGDQDASPHGRHRRGGWSNQGESGAPDQTTPATGISRDGAYGSLEVNNMVWIDKFLYVEALDNAVENSTTIIYSLPPDPKPLAATINLPGDMLLGEVNSHVQVLGLSETSPAYLAGVRPGDVIKSIGNASSLSVTTLNDFVGIYAIAKQQAESAGQASAPIDFWNPKELKKITAEINFPPST
jgi:hypothetical protein